MTIVTRKAAVLAVAVLGLAISMIAKDLSVPLFTLSMFGLIDRLMAGRFLS